MTNHARLVRAEHILTARTKTNRSRRHEISDQRRADNCASNHVERITALHERHRAKTGEKFVEETGLRDGTGGGGRPRHSRPTSITQILFYFEIKKKNYVTNTKGVDHAHHL